MNEAFELGVHAFHNRLFITNTYQECDPRYRAFENGVLYAAREAGAVELVEILAEQQEEPEPFHDEYGVQGY